MRDADPDIRITGLRAARLIEHDLLGYAERVAEDPSPQVRREVAIALRYESGPRAAAIWTTLALQHDGDDRYPLSLREAAVLAFVGLPTGRGERVEGAPSLGDRRLLELVEVGMLPPELEDAAATVLFGSPRRDVRNGATRLLTPPTATTADGKPIPPTEELAARTGDVARG